MKTINTNAPCFGKKLGHNFIGGICLNGCGITQAELSGRKKPVETDFFDGYLKRLLSRRKIKGRNYMEEITLPYLKCIKWSNDEKFFKEIAAFWVVANKSWKRKTPFEYERLLKWVEKKNTLYPGQVMKAMNK